MPNISQETAGRITKELLQKRRDAIKDLKKQLSNKVRDIYLKTIPGEVLHFFSNHEKWINTASDVKILSSSWDYRFISVEKVPKISQPSITLTPVEDKALGKLRDQIDAEESAVNKLERETKNALLSLRTYKRIQEQFPEAGALLPSDPSAPSTALIVDLSKIRAALV